MKPLAWKPAPEITVQNVGSVHGDIYLQFPGYQGGYPKVFGLTIHQACHLHAKLTEVLQELRKAIDECKPLEEINDPANL